LRSGSLTYIISRLYVFCENLQLWILIQDILNTYVHYNWLLFILNSIMPNFFLSLFGFIVIHVWFMLHHLIMVTSLLITTICGLTWSVTYADLF
jgi:hypothetical protein